LLHPALEVFDVLRHLAVPPAVLKEVRHEVRDQLVNVRGSLAPDVQQFLLAIGQPMIITD
jgi:hypothetical protein